MGAPAHQDHRPRTGSPQPGLLWRGLLIGMLLVRLVGVLNGCTGGVPDAVIRPSPEATADPTVITFDGLPGLPLGASLADLEASGAATTTGPGCGARFTAVDQASPVFDQGRLVMVWAYPPLHTPEGISAGSTIAEARAAYPELIELTRPPGSTEYPGLLVRGAGDKAYLLLHDAIVIQKVIVGYETSVRRLFDTRFGTC